MAATGIALHSEAALTGIAQRFRDWYDGGPADIGTHTRAVLWEAGRDPTGATMTATSYDLHARTGHTAGNGSLMRTAPVALPHLGDPDALADAARKVGALTHYDQRAQEACVLWSLAIRHAILHGELEVRGGLGTLDAEGAGYWSERLDEAESADPARFRPNGWVVAALQAAWSAIFHTSASAGAGSHLVDGLRVAISIGDETDTVAAIAGALLGATYGASAVPAHWREILHGYPGLTGDQLVDLALRAVAGEGR